MKRINVLRLGVDGEIEQVEIPAYVEDYQRMVGGSYEIAGYIEPAGDYDEFLLAIANEEGFLLHLPKNENASRLLGFTIVGDVFLVLDGEDDFEDFPSEQEMYIRKIIEEAST